MLWWQECGPRAVNVPTCGPGWEHRHRRESARRSIVANPGSETPTSSCDALRPRPKQPRLSPPRATRCARCSAWPTGPRSCDPAIRSCRGPVATMRSSGASVVCGLAASQMVGFKPAGTAVSRREPISGPQQLWNHQLRLARDEYRIPLLGSCAAFATPPPAADRPPQTRRTPSYLDPDPARQTVRHGWRPALDFTPVGRRATR